MRIAGISNLNIHLHSDHRGLAYSLAEMDLFRIQIRAILRASGKGNIRIMFPMVLGPADLHEACRIVDEMRELEKTPARPRIGAMIETPSSVFNIQEILQAVDFASIGTNDLAHFILTSERRISDLPGVAAFLQPGVLKATDQIIRAANEQGVELSVCGEAASDPASACLLAGMGVRSLSMSPFLAARVRQTLQRITLPRAEAATRDALAAISAVDIQTITFNAFGDISGQSAS